MSVLHERNCALLKGMIPDNGHMLPTSENIDQTRKWFVSETEDLIRHAILLQKNDFISNRDRKAEHDRLYKVMTDLSDESKLMVYDIFQAITFREYGLPSTQKEGHSNEYVNFWNQLKESIDFTRQTSNTITLRRQLAMHIAVIFNTFHLQLNTSVNGPLWTYIDLVQEEINVKTYDTRMLVQLVINIAREYQLSCEIIDA